MQRAFVFLAAAGLSAVILLLSTQQVQAQKPTTSRTIIEETYDLQNPCTDEIMTVTDRYQVILFDQYDKEGCDRFSVHFNDMGSKAVGTVSGAKFQYPYAATQFVIDKTVCDGCIFELWYTINTQFVGQGQYPNAHARVSYHAIYNSCTDEETVIRDSAVITCDNE